MKSRLESLFPSIVGELAPARDAEGQVHLTPFVDEGSIISDYRSRLRDIFKSLFARGVPVRMIATPSFDPEYAVGLRVPARGLFYRRDPEIIALAPTVMIWHLFLGDWQPSRHGAAEGGRIPITSAESPTGAWDIPVRRHVRGVPADLAFEIVYLWRDALQSVRHPKEPNQGLDGETYDFSGSFGIWGDLRGQTWSPEPGSKVGRLVSMVEAMAKYARGEARLGRLKAKVATARKP